MTPSESPPLAIRCLLAVDRLYSAVAWLLRIRDEVLFAACSEALRDRVNRAQYAGQKRYLPGARFFDAGLMDWETDLMSHPAFPKAGFVLVGGAGAGRELVALGRRGFRSLGFDPSPELVEAGKKTALENNATLVVGRYEDIVEAVFRGQGPLAAPLANQVPDAVLLSYGSISHVGASETRFEIFRAIRTLAPTAPVALSFLHGRLRDKPVRGVAAFALKIIARVTGGRVRQSGESFIPSTGFLGGTTVAEVKEFAENLGYDVLVLRETPYPHALLAPKDGPHRQVHAA